MPENNACTLEVVTDGKNRTITLDEKIVTFGRSRKNTVSLKEDSKISADHCQVVRQKDAWMLIDSGSKNKTFLNGTAISVAALKHGDTFKIGNTSVTFRVGVPTAMDPKEAEKLMARQPSSNSSAGRAIAAALAAPAEPRAAKKSSGVRDAIRVERGGKGISMIAMSCFFFAGILSGVTALLMLDNRGDKKSNSIARVEQKAKSLVQDAKNLVVPVAEDVKNATVQNPMSQIKTRIEDLRQVIQKSSPKDAVLKSLSELRTELANSKDVEEVRGEFEELKKTVLSMDGDVAWLKGEFEALRKTYFDQGKDEPVVAVKDPPVVPVKNPPVDPPVDPVSVKKPPVEEPVTVKKEPVDAPPPASDDPVAGDPVSVKPPVVDPKAPPVDPGTTTDPDADAKRPPAQFMGLKTTLKRIVFVMDVTGSMEDPVSTMPADFMGAAEIKISAALKGQIDKFDRKDVKTKLDAAKYELTHTIAYLHPDVEFTVIFYSFSPTPWQKRLMVASEKNKIDAIKRIKTTSAWGGTNIYDALECAFQICDDYKKTMKKTPAPKDGVKPAKAGPDFAIFLVTDGKHNTGRFPDPEEFLKEIRKMNADDRALIDTIGVGQPGVGVDPPDPVFLARLAGDNGGESKMLK